MDMQNQHGVTLLELVIVIILIGIISLVATRMLVQGLTAYVTAENISDADWQGRLALERMERDLHAVRSAADISTATATQFTFTDISGASVSYTLSGSTLMRNSNPLANGIQSITFTYADKNGAATAVLSAIRYVTVTINVTQKNTNLSLTTSANLRDVS